MANIEFLLDRLEDPFELFPLQCVSNQLGAQVDECGLRLHERNGPYGVSEQFRSIEGEHENAMEQLFIGSSFVLCQTAITRAISIVNRVRAIAGESSRLPARRSAIMAAGAPLHRESGLSKIVIIDAVANYFKHHFEWSADWSGPDRAKETIALVVRLGLGPCNESNLSQSLRVLEISHCGLGKMAHLVQDWRESLASHCRVVLNAPSPRNAI